MVLSTKTYKGARDFYPADKRLQKYMFNVWRESCERFGYEEYDAPLIEPVEIYLAKTGDEIVNEQTYSFTDRGGREVVIRPEMTPTVSRMVAAKRQELAYPLRWFSIPNLWRYERPQKGRLREHWQLNVDLFGVKDIGAEQEMIQLINEIFKAFNASPDMYEIRLNHRGLIDYLLHDYLGLSGQTKQAIGKLIDRWHKLDKHDFISKTDAILDPQQKQAGVTEKLLKLLSTRRISDLPGEVADNQAYLELKYLLKHLRSAGINNAVFDGSLMRGFDYYTGIVFEVFDLNPDNNRSMLGGGRYDGLVGMFGVPPLPTVGFGWGDVTLENFLRGHHLLPHLASETRVYIVTIGEVGKQVPSIAAQLRAAGINTAVDLSGKRLGDQLKTADKKGIEQVLIVGEDEIKNNQLTLKNLTSGEEAKADLKHITEIIKADAGD